MSGRWAFFMAAAALAAAWPARAPAAEPDGLAEALDKARRAASAPKPAAGPVKEDAVAEGLRKGLAYLKVRQEADGLWRQDSVSWCRGSRPAIACFSAFALQALEQNGETPREGHAKTVRAIHEYALSKKEYAALMNPDPYGFHCGLGTAARDDDKERMAQYFVAIDTMQRTAGDNYSHMSDRPASFQKALILMSLLEAKEHGATPPQALLQRTTADLGISRGEDGYWNYHIDKDWKARGGDDSSRAPLGELALLLAGEAAGRAPNPRALREAVERFAGPVNQVDLASTLLGEDKAHVGPGGRSKYFDLFGFYWAARGLQKIASLPRERGDDPAGTARRLMKTLAAQQRPDGSWEDSAHFAGPVYGTAYAVMALHLLRDVAQAK